MYSPASEDGGSRSEGSSDSKSSLETPAGHDAQHPPPHHRESHHHEAHHMFAHGLGPALAALRKKRKKFSVSRSSTPAMTSSTNTNPPEPSATHPIARVLASSRVVSKKQLQRASSVPTRGPDLAPQSIIIPRRHEVTQSQQPSLDVGEIGWRSEIVETSISEQPGERLKLLTLREVNRRILHNNNTYDHYTTIIIILFRRSRVLLIITIL